MSLASDVTPRPADVFVIFGITGDLAKVMTFHSLYRLERRGLLDCPIVGWRPSDWTVDELREHARQCIADCGKTIDDEVFDRFAARLSYVTGDFGDAATYERVGKAHRRCAQPGVLPRDPAVPVRDGDQGPGRGGSDQDGPRGRGEAVRPRPRVGPRAGRRRSTSTSTSPSSTGSTTSWGRWAWARSSTCGSRTRCSSRSGTATTSRACRSRWPRASGSRTAATSTTRSARCATWSSTT